MANQRTLITTFFSVFAIFGFLGLINSNLASLAALLLIISSGVGIWFFRRTMPAASSSSGLPVSMAEREHEARKLRASRERERAFYEMTTTLSSTLDQEKVLITVQDLGNLVTRYQDSHAKLVSAALLFQDDHKNLHVASSRGLTRHDHEVNLAGQEGVLGLAMKQTEPVFGGQASRDPELSYFTAFQMCKSVLAIPLRAGFDYYGVLVFGSSEENAFSEDYVDLLKAIGTQATIALQNSALYEKVLQEKERIVEVDEEARKKLARDLHDGPTQVIAAIAMRINFVRRLIESQNEQAQQELGKIEDLARRTTKEIRHMLFTLRPLILETQGIKAALEQLAEKMKDTHSQNVSVDVQGAIERYLDHHQQGVIFYIVEEAVNNARKHAQAALIAVRIYQRESNFMVEIEDNGVGFDQSAVEAGFKRNSLGMVNLRERTEMLQGTLRIDSQVGRGTKIMVVVPVKEPLSMPAPATAPDAKLPITKPIPRASQIRRITSESPAATSQPKSPIKHANKLSPSD